MRIAIIGGGLAGLAAAVALSGRGLKIELFEAKRRLGGRAGSYSDRETGELIDHCQHVAMGCCTNYLDFCKRTAIADLFDRHETLHFFSPDGRRSDFRPSRWLPAPLHLLPALVGLKHLSLAEKVAIGRAMLNLMRTPKGSGVFGGKSLSKIDGVNPPKTPDPVVLDWLNEQRQPERAIARFWQVVLVSALGESLDRASLSAARKVFLDGFLGHRAACHVIVPRVSLGELYDERVARWLIEWGVVIHLESSVEQVVGDADDNAAGIRLRGEADVPFDQVLLAVPWRRAVDLLPERLLARAPALEQARSFASVPITSVHLWLDRPITDLPHAVLVGRLSQWLFRRTDFQSVGEGRIGNPSYYQIVISASHDLAGRSRNSIRDEVLADLRTIFPAAGEANLVRCQVLTEHEAVFSVRPGIEGLRPGQTTPIANLYLAGDWTRTGWPATMEGAVRSGYLAAEAVLTRIGRQEQILAPDLPRGWLVKGLGARARG